MDRNLLKTYMFAYPQLTDHTTGLQYLFLRINNFVDLAGRYESAKIYVSS